MKIRKTIILAILFFLYYALAHTQTTAYQVTKAESNLYTGHYEFSEQRILRIIERDNKFYGQLTGASELELTPSGPAEFYFIDIDARVDFKGTPNKTHSLIMHRSKEEEGIKLNISNAKLKKRHASKYIGNYELGEGVLFEIYYKDNQLKAKQNGTPLSLIPLREDLFYIPERVMKLGFNKNFDGKIASLTLFTNNKVEIPKI